MSIDGGERYTFRKVGADGRIWILARRWRIIKKINLCEELINKLSNDNIRIVIVLNDEFNTIKDKYVKDLKAGNKYEVIDEKRDLIEFNNGDLVTKALDVFGKDIVEIE